jgi:hypothetical protein
MSGGEQAETRLLIFAVQRSAKITSGIDERHRRRRVML